MSERMNLLNQPAAHGMVRTTEMRMPMLRSVRFPLLAKWMRNMSNKNRAMKRTISPASMLDAYGNVCPLNMKHNASSINQNM